MEDANIPITSKKVSIGIPLRTWMFLNRFSVTRGACAACCADTRMDIAASRHAITVAMAQTIGPLRPHLILSLPPQLLQSADERRYGGQTCCALSEKDGSRVPSAAFERGECYEPECSRSTGVSLLRDGVHGNSMLAISRCFPRHSEHQLKGSFTCAEQH